MITVGCDQHKKYSFAVAKDDKGQVVSQSKLYHADKSSVRAFFGAFPKGKVVALEACGFDHWLGDLLEELGLRVKLAHTAKTKAIAEERIKTDKISANVLADLVHWDLLPQAYRAPRPVRDARTLMRYRLRLVGIRSNFKNKIHSILDYQGIQRDFSDLYGTDGRRFLDQLSSRPCTRAGRRSTAAASPKTATNICAPLSSNRPRPLFARTRISRPTSSA